MPIQLLPTQPTNPAASAARFVSEADSSRRLSTRRSVDAVRSAGVASGGCPGEIWYSSVGGEEGARRPWKRRASPGRRRDGFGASARVVGAVGEDAPRRGAGEEELTGKAVDGGEAGTRLVPLDLL